MGLRRRNRNARPPGGDSGARAPAADASGRAGAPRARGGDVVLDITDRAGWAARIDPDPARAARLAEERRARAARAAALEDLKRLRARHWSGDRLIEEIGAPDEWWEHPDADPYAVLGLLPGATLDQAAAARRHIARDCHPDRAALSQDERAAATSRLVAANAAYDRIRRALIPV